MSLAMRAKRAAQDAGSFALIIAGVLALVAALGQWPTCLAPDPRPHVCGSALEAEEVLGARLLLPAYFPDRFAWPPVYRAGRLPTPWVAMDIARRDRGGSLVLVQSIGEDPPAPRETGRFVRREPLAFGDGGATLEVYEEGGASSYRLRWRRGERRLVLAGSEAPETLIRIARTMRSRTVTEAE